MRRATFGFSPLSRSAPLHGRSVPLHRDNVNVFTIPHLQFQSNAATATNLGPVAAATAPSEPTTNLAFEPDEDEDASDLAALLDSISDKSAANKIPVLIYHQQTHQSLRTHGFGVEGVGQLR